jgi:hypothetical protein
MGVGLFQKLRTIFNALEINPLAAYEREKKEITRRISGGGITREELLDMSRRADKSMANLERMCK